LGLPRLREALVEQYKHKYLVALREGLVVPDPYMKKLIAKYKNRDTAELDTDEEARETIKGLIYKPDDDEPRE
jgi:hypothetical protein